MVPSSAGGAGQGRDRLVRLVVRVLDGHLRRVARTARAVDAEAARARLRTLHEDLGGSRVLLFYWIEDALPLMLGARLAEDFLRSEIAFIRDETVGGRITSGMLERAGRPVRDLRTSPPAARARDVQDLIRDPGWLGIAVDGRGPYRRVGLPFARLAARRDGFAIPLAARVDRAWTVRAGAALRIPRRGTAVTVRFGEPIPCRPGADATLLQRLLQDGLDETVAAAERALRGGVARAASASS